MVISIVPTTLKFLQGWDKGCPNFNFVEINKDRDYPCLEFISQMGGILIFI
jgi:hypothetical protein